MNRSKKKYTNIHNLPEAIVNAVINDPYNPGPSDLTVTKLISPPRLVALTALHKDEIVEDVAACIWKIFGAAVHVVLERAGHKGNPDVQTEERLTIERNGLIISGAFDRFTLTDGVLQDFKVTSTYSVKNGHRREWEWQLNVLAAILREHGMTVNKIECVVILRDWSNGFAQRTEDYPPAPVVTLEMPLWSEERCEEFIFERIRLHQMAKTQLPLCSQEERWARPDQFALMRENRKAAVRVFDSIEDAEAALAQTTDGKHFIQHRPGKSVRCESWCQVADYCDQWRAEEAAAKV